MELLTTFSKQKYSTAAAFQTDLFVANKVYKSERESLAIPVSKALEIQCS